MTSNREHDDSEIRIPVYLFLWERPEKLFEKNASQVRCIVM